MATPFTHTLRSLDRPHGRGFLWGLGATLVLFGLWLGWFLFGELAVHAVGSARLEADRRPHRLMTSVAGQVSEVLVELGDEVRAGQALVVFDDEALLGMLVQERARLAASRQRLAALEAQLRGEMDRKTELQRSSGSATREIRSRQDQAIAALRDAEAEVERLRPLVELGILGRAELERAEGVVSQLEPAAEAHARAVDRSRGEAGVDLADATVRVRALEASLAQEQGQITDAEAQIERWNHELEHYRVTAPVDGQIGQLRDVQPGDVLSAGEVLGSVIPAGEMRVIADFEPSVAVGRIREGQAASMAFDGFPWTQFGRLRATVSKVATEPGSGRIRVELTPDEVPGTEVPLQHGLPGTVEVEVERLAPAQLVLRLAGRRLSSGAPEP